MDDLAPVIEHIASISAKTEAGRWELAEAIHNAFSELPAYEHGLLSGLCERLKYTSTNIYNLRNSYQLMISFNGYAPKLHVSHYSKMYNLIARYKLETDEIIDVLLTTEQENLSVASMSMLVEDSHEPDPKGKYEKDIKRFITLGRRILNDPLNKLDKSLYANLYDLIKEMEKL